MKGHPYFLSTIGFDYWVSMRHTRKMFISIYENNVLKMRKHNNLFQISAQDLNKNKHFVQDNNLFELLWITHVVNTNTKETNIYIFVRSTNDFQLFSFHFHYRDLIYFQKFCFSKIDTIQKHQVIVGKKRSPSLREMKCIYSQFLPICPV